MLDFDSNKHLNRFEYPNSFTFLKSVIRPSKGGETIFSDTTKAYEDLPEVIKQQVDGKTGFFSYLKVREENRTIFSQEEIAYLHRGSVHPIITAHPVTGKKNIFANPADTISIQNMEEDESQILLDFLENGCICHIQQ